MLFRSGQEVPAVGVAGEAVQKEEWVSTGVAPLKIVDGQASRRNDSFAGLVSEANVELYGRVVSYGTHSSHNGNESPT